MAKVFLNYINARSIHENTNKDGKAFKSVSIPWSDPRAVTGFAKINVQPGQVIPCTDRQGNVVDGRNNIVLGKSDSTRKVNICVSAKTDTAEAVYEDIEMTNAEIKAMYDDSRKAYKKSLAIATADTETGAVAEVTAEPAPKRRGRPKGSKNKAK